ncbi:MAG: archease [Spirochaetes bacterium]|nr:archease [Spirochaetota bacterium]
MTGSFEIVDDLTCADVAIRINAHALEEILVHAARALLSILLENPGDFSPKRWEPITITAENEEMLLYHFLDELVFLKDSKKALALFDGGSVEKRGDRMVLTGTIAIDEIDFQRHRFNVDVKAVTMHGLSCKKEGDGYIAQVVFDV